MKRDQQKVFYLEFWKIDSVFLYEVYLFSYKNVFIFDVSCLKVCFTFVACNGAKRLKINNS